jgi:hypothetical protein
LKELWDDFGIVGDLIVSELAFQSSPPQFFQPFTTGFPRADIHELITMDLLHQVIKGTFKDHVVEWVQEYIEETRESAEAARILADIDRRYFCFLSSLILISLLETPQHRCHDSVPGPSSFPHWSRV